MTPAPSPSPRAPAAQRKAGRIALRSAISLALLLLLISQIHLGETIAVVAQARTDLLALLFLAILADRILSAYRWFLLLRGVGSRQTFLEVVRLVFVSSFLGYFSPGGLGVDAVRIYGFARASSDMGLAVTSVIVDRALGMLALLLLVLMALLSR